MKDFVGTPQAPCEYGTCPSDLIRQSSDGDPAHAAEQLAECARVLGKIVQAGDYQILIAHREASPVADKNNRVCFSNSPCPLMTPYSLERA